MLKTQNHIAGDMLMPQFIAQKHKKLHRMVWATYNKESSKGSEKSILLLQKLYNDRLLLFFKQQITHNNRLHQTIENQKELWWDE